MSEELKQWLKTDELEKNPDTLRLERDRARAEVTAFRDAYRMLFGEKGNASLEMLERIVAGLLARSL